MFDLKALLDRFAYLEELMWLLLGRTNGASGQTIFGPWTADVLPAASPFTPTAQQIMVAFDTSTGPVTIKTPLAEDGVSLPVNGQIFCMKPSVASVTPGTVQANGAGVTVEDPSNAGTFGATGSVLGQGSGAWFKFRSSDKKWLLMPGSAT